MTGDDPGGDGGSGTVLVIGLIGVLVVVGAALGLLGGAVHARERARSAADLAALAAAQVEIGHGTPSPAGDCRDPVRRAAVAVADANGAALTQCVLLGDGSVLVTAAVPLHGPLSGTGPATAQARAGPPPAVP